MTTQQQQDRATIEQGIVVDFKNPPPWIVHLIFEKKRAGSSVAIPVPTTWPFQTEEEARIAYGMAVGSGQFTRIYRSASKNVTELSGHLVGLWYRDDKEGVDGTMHLSYTLVPVPDDDPMSSISMEEGLMRLALVGTGARLEMAAS